MRSMATASSSYFGMNTPITHQVFGVNAQKALDAGKKRLNRLEKMWSRFNPTSEISRINAGAGGKDVRISRETGELLAQAKSFSSLSSGLFSVTVCPLVDLWDYKHARHVPAAEDIARTLPLVNDAGLQLNAAGGIARLTMPHQSIDLGGIGKGFACDEINKTFQEYGITSAVTNVGGNVSVLGAKPDGTPWRVGIRHPRLKDRLLGCLLVTDCSVVTSGDDQRFFVADNGKRYHHILDPQVGFPAESGLLSVTVVAKSSAAADALSTILFIAGIEKGLEILSQFPRAEAVFFTADRQVCLTSGLKDSFLTDVNMKISYLEK